VHQHPRPAHHPRRRVRRVVGAVLVAVTAATAVAVPGATATPAAPATARAAAPYGPFDTASELVRQTYLDFLLREPTSSELQVASTALQGGQTPAALVAAVAATAESNTNVRAVVRLYRAYYLRNPDHGGLKHWIRQRQLGTSLSQISNQFAAAPEFALRYGYVDDAEFVDLVYGNVLDRGPDAGGRAYWIGLLGKGLYRGQLMTKFSESGEFVRKSSGIVTAVHIYDSLFQQSIPRGLSDSYGPSLLSGRTTPEELAETLMGSAKYTSRFT
jgi:hypothetical protein